MLNVMLKVDVANFCSLQSFKGTKTFQNFNISIKIQKAIECKCAVEIKLYNQFNFIKLTNKVL